MNASWDGSVPSHFRLTVTLTSDLIARIGFESGAYHPYSLKLGIPNFGVWVPLWMIICCVPFLVTVTLTSDLVFIIIVSDQISYIISARKPKFGVWLHLGMAECQIPSFGSL